MVGPVTAAVFLVPIEVLGIIEPKFQPVLIAGLGQFRHDVAAKRRGVHHVVLVHLGMEQREPIVVLAGKHKILHAAALGQANPFVRVEIQRIESLGQRAIFRVGDAEIRLNPFRVFAAGLAPVFPGQQRIQSPMRHHAVFCLLEPFSVVHTKSPPNFL